jgi:hypothetical protein
MFDQPRLSQQSNDLNSLNTMPLTTNSSGLAGLASDCGLSDLHGQYFRSSSSSNDGSGKLQRLADISGTSHQIAGLASSNINTLISESVQRVYAREQNAEVADGVKPLVGIIDTGFEISNPNLHGNVTLGQDRVDADNNPLLAEGSGDEHGTQILDTIAERDGNAPLWLGRAVGSGKWAESLVEFVDVAKASGQKNAIANLSFDLTQVNPDGGITTRTRLTAEEHNALKYAHDNGIVVVAAAGNTGGEMSALGQASREFDNIITVGAAEGLNRADYSSYGKGLMLLADGRAQDSSMGEGSSIATAKVSADVAQVWEANSNLNYRQVIDILKSTALDLKTMGWDAETGSGLVNIETAIVKASRTIPVTLEASQEGQSQRGDLAPDITDQTGTVKLGERPTSWGIFKKIAGAITQPFVQVAEAVAEHVVEPIVESAWNVTKDVGEGAWNIAEDVGEGAWNITKDLGEGAWDITKDVGEGAWNIAEDVGEGAWNITKDLGEGAWDITKDVGEGAWNIAKDVGEGAWNITKDLGEGAWDITKDVGEGAWNITKDVGEGVWDVTKDLSQGHIFDAITDIGEAITNIAEDSVNTVAGIARDTGETIFDVVKDGFKTGLNIAEDTSHSVLEIAKHSGETAIELAKDGFETGFNLVKDEFHIAGEILNDSIHTTEQISGTILHASEKVVEDYIRANVNVFQDVGNAAGQILEPITPDFVKSSVDWMGQNIVKPAELAVTEVWGGAKWFADQVSDKTFGIPYRAVHWAEQLPDRVERLGHDIVSGQNEWLGKEHGKKNVGDWLKRVAIDFGDIIGLGEQYEIGADWVKFNTRKLSEHEVDVAKGIFGDSLNYDLIRIDGGAFIGPKSTNRPYTSFHTINSWGDLKDDSVLIHELTHIWQYEHDGSIYMPDALIAQKSPGITPGTDGYDYGGVETLKAHWNDGLGFFNYEAQAHIIEDFYKLKEKVSNLGVDANSVDQDSLQTYTHFVSEISA